MVKKGVSILDLVRIYNHLNNELNKLVKKPNPTPNNLLFFGVNRLQTEIRDMHLKLEVLRRFKKSISN